MPSPHRWPRSTNPNGWCIPSRPSTGQKPCSPISAATPIEWRSPTIALLAADADTVAFRWKDYRVKNGDRQKVMRVATREFIRRFLMHVLPDGFHRIRHYGLLASGVRKTNLAKCRALLCDQAPEQASAQEAEPEVARLTLREPCRCCGGPMRIIEIFRRGQADVTRVAEGAGRMTYKPSVKVSKPNLGWLHQAEPARTRCADHSLVWLANNPCWLHQVESARSRWPDRSWVWLTNCNSARQGRCSRTMGRDSLVSSDVKSANRHADIAVASSVSALSP